MTSRFYGNEEETGIVHISLSCIRTLPVFETRGAVQHGVRVFRLRGNWQFFLFFEARSQTCEKRLLVSSCLSVRPNSTTRLSSHGFSCNLTFQYFLKICRDNSSFFQIGQEKRVLYMKPNIRFWSYRAYFLLEWKMLQAKFYRKSKYTFYFQYFFRKSCRLRDNVEKYCRGVQATDDNMAHAHFVLDT
jgi:hypothetical protein